MKINRLSGKISGLYYVSSSPSLSGEIIRPGIPNNVLTKGKYENTTIPRVALFGSVSDAISGQFLGQILEEGTRLYVYRPLGINRDNLLETSLSTTPYCLLIDEKWHTLPLRVELLSEIEITGLEKVEEYRYGARVNIGRIYRWTWKEILHPWEKKRGSKLK